MVTLGSSAWLPLFHASEKMELTTLWERTWPEDVVSDMPLSDWLEWLDWDSVGMKESPSRVNGWTQTIHKLVKYQAVSFENPICLPHLADWRSWSQTWCWSWRGRTSREQPLCVSWLPGSSNTAASHTALQITDSATNPSYCIHINTPSRVMSS